jgi:hypothetical protein
MPEPSTPITTPPEPSSAIPISIPSHPTRKSTRPKNTPSHLKNYVCSTFLDTSTPSSSTPYHISNYVSFDNLSASQCRFFLVSVYSSRTQVFY